MIKTILLVLLAAIVVFLVAAAMQPDDFRITRSISVAAPPATVSALVNDFHRWQEWSPWAKMDPAAKATYDGPASGVGAKFAWAGNSQVGEGRMTIIDDRPGELVRLTLEFVKPFAATNTAEFTFKGEGPGTLVTWSMTGRNNLMGKAISLIMNCDKMVGGEFEKGLADIKRLAEAKK